VTHTFSTFIPPCPPGPFTPNKLSLPFPTRPKFADPAREVHELLVRGKGMKWSSPATAILLGKKGEKARE
jgi:hypothetical protein